jgi:hypothetical protein
LAAVLLFLEVKKESLGEKRKSLLKMAALTDDYILSQLHSITIEYQSATTVDDGCSSAVLLLRSVDELIKSSLPAVSLS